MRRPRQSIIRHAVVFATCCLVVTVAQWVWSWAFGFPLFSGRGDSSRFLIASAPFLVFILPGSALLNQKLIVSVITPAHWVIGALTWGATLYVVFRLLFFIDDRLRRASP